MQEGSDLVVEKNQFESTGLNSLGDFITGKVRNQSAFGKNYMDGEYGAVPCFEKDEQLKKILYERWRHEQFKERTRQI